MIQTGEILLLIRPRTGDGGRRTEVVHCGRYAVAGHGHVTSVTLATGTWPMTSPAPILRTVTSENYKAKARPD